MMVMDQRQIVMVVFLFREEGKKENGFFFVRLSSECRTYFISIDKKERRKSPNLMSFSRCCRSRSHSRILIDNEMKTLEHSADLDQYVLLTLSIFPHAN